MTDPIVFAVALITLLGLPGPTNALLATAGATAGIRRSLPLLAGELAGYVIAVATLRLVLGPLTTALPLVGIALKLGVAIYLCRVAFRLWTSGADTAGGQSVGWRTVFVATLLNPKSLVLTLSILPAAHPQLGWYLAGFALAVPATGLGWVLVGRAIGATSGERHAGTVRRTASVILVGFAGLISASVFG